MRSLSLIMLLVSSIICAAAESVAAPMKYSLTFRVVGEATFNGDILDSSSIFTIDLYGNSDDMYLEQGRQVIDEMQGVMRIPELGTFDLSGTYKLTGGEQPVAELALGGSSALMWGIIGENVWLDQEYGNTEVAVVLFDMYTSGGVFDPNGTASDGTYSAATVPIPNAILLLSSGVALLIGFRRKFASK